MAISGIQATLFVLAGQIDLGLALLSTCLLSIPSAVWIVQVTLDKSILYFDEAYAKVAITIIAVILFRVMTS
jgi:hypothetical protein